MVGWLVGFKMVGYKKIKKICRNLINPSIFKKITQIIIITYKLNNDYEKQIVQFINKHLL